jgi:hypothetical protein
LCSNYPDHLLLYRQAQIYARQGIDLPEGEASDQTSAPVQVLAHLR